MRKKGVKKLVITTAAMVGLLAGIASADVQARATYGGVSIDTTVSDVYYTSGVYKINTAASNALFSTVRKSKTGTSSTFSAWVVDDSTGGREFASKKRTLGSIGAYTFPSDTNNSYEVGKAYDLKIYRISGTKTLRVVGSFTN